MKVMKKSNKDTAASLENENYEYKLCGGAVEPKDRKESKNASEAQDK